MRASRLLSILILLQLRQRVNAQGLAREFEVSIRTIYRDIDALSAAGVPVFGDRGPGGGFSLLGRFKTELTGLFDDEAQSLALMGLPGAARDLGLDGGPQRVHNKLMAALPHETAASAGRLQARLHVDPLSWYQDGMHAPHLQALARATLGDCRIEVVYESWKGQRRHTLEPLGIVLKAGQWYAVARTVVAPGTSAEAKTITLKVSAIQNLVVHAVRFRRDTKFDLATWWAASNGRFERDLRPERAVLLVSEAGCRRLAELGSYAKAALANASESAITGWRRVTLPIESEEQAVRLVLSLTPEVVIESPLGLRRRLVLVACAAAEQHAHST